MMYLSIRQGSHKFFLLFCSYFVAPVKKGVKNKGKYAKEIVEITCAGHRVAVLNTLSN